MNRSSPFLGLGLAARLFCVSVTAWLSLVETARSQEFGRTFYYVSTKGNDRWSGRLPAPSANRDDGPFATLTAARNAIRRLKATKNLPGAAEVLILDGTHHLTEPFVLTAEDTGTEKQPVTGMLYFWPPEELRPGDVIAPVIDSLMEMRGTAESPLRHITVSGLTFSHTRSPFPDDLHPNFHSPTRRGAGVTLEHCDGCRIERNRFVMLGGDGVRLKGPNSRNEVVGNEIGHVGGAGVVLVSLDRDGNAGDTKDFADPAVLRRHSSRYPRLIRNVISDNEIHHCGRIKKNCGGVQMYGINSVDTLIAHNRIHDMSDKGMTMQDGFGRFIVEYNDINRIGQEIADTGGIMVNRWFVHPDDPDLSAGSMIRSTVRRPSPRRRFLPTHGCAAGSPPLLVLVAPESSLENAPPPRARSPWPVNRDRHPSSVCVFKPHRALLRNRWQGGRSLDGGQPRS